jgi:hypothetical protein
MSICLEYPRSLKISLRQQRWQGKAVLVIAFFPIQPTLIPSPTAAKATASASVILTRFSFIDSEAPTHPVSAVEFRNGFIFFGITVHFDKPKPTHLPCFAISGKLDSFDRPIFSKNFSQVGLRDLKRKIPNVD